MAEKRKEIRDRAKKDLQVRGNYGVVLYMQELKSITEGDWEMSMRMNAHDTRSIKNRIRYIASLVEEYMKEEKIHVCPTVIELIKKYETLERKYDDLSDSVDELLRKIRERKDIPITTTRKEIESTVRDIVDEIIEEKQRMGEWP